ncbi:MAG: hemerythrin domain-containing protein [Duganella sp.]
MNAISQYLERDHRRCDDQYTLAEAEVARRQWESARTEFTRFTVLFLLHLDKEERVLYPQMDRMLGNAAGATTVMRTEHAYMRAIIGRMARTLVARDSNRFFDEADSLRRLMRQHHLKEEAVFYPMADRLLHPRADEVTARMDALDALAEALPIEGS